MSTITARAVLEFVQSRGVVHPREVDAARAACGCTRRNSPMNVKARRIQTPTWTR